MVLDEFSPEQIVFMRELSAELEEKGWCCPLCCRHPPNYSVTEYPTAEIFKTIRKAHQDEHEYYFLSQMYEYSWKP